MGRITLQSGVYVLITGWIVGCSPTDAPAPEKQPDANRVTIRPADSIESRRDAILAAARDYRSFDFVSPELRWSPYDCAPPPPIGPRFSASDSEATHGRKLYYLYARNGEAYMSLPTREGPQPTGQTLVKEAWIPREVAADFVTERDPSPSLRPVGNPGDPRTPDPVALDGKRWGPGEKGPLFVMHYLGTSAEESDDGWIYATLTPDGAEITAMGLIDSCMKCHQRAERGRLFGLPLDDFIDDDEAAESSEPSQ
ncbi:MAG TPA: hypothetical protein P5081_00175 [Phycisphaerae bacterium]|nr:hypothetical protein [Phycisphaerae bacterium]HRW51268.1 hypothetical protein [Phycisphaerae bacterium]